MTFPKPKLTSRATAEGLIEAVKIEFDFAKWREWKKQYEKKL